MGTDQNKTSTNFSFFMGKRCRIILTFANGKAITYRGSIISIDDDSILFHDLLMGDMLIGKKDISQILEI